MVFVFVCACEVIMCVGVVMAGVLCVGVVLCLKMGCGVWVIYKCDGLLCLFCFVFGDLCVVDGTKHTSTHTCWIVTTSCV